MRKIFRFLRVEGGYIQKLMGGGGGFYTIIIIAVHNITCNILIALFRCSGRGGEQR